MDDGYVIPGLNENWTFAGAKPMEWASGLVAMILVNEFFISNMGRSMPILLMVLVLVPMTLATLRQSYPDEERGLRNHLMSIIGIAPPDIAPPSMIQPEWSGLPMRDMPQDKLFMQLGLDMLINEEKVDSELE